MSAPAHNEHGEHEAHGILDELFAASKDAYKKSEDKEESSGGAEAHGDHHGPSLLEELIASTDDATKKKYDSVIEMHNPKKQAEFQYNNLYGTSEAPDGGADTIMENVYKSITDYATKNEFIGKNDEDSVHHSLRALIIGTLDNLSPAAKIKAKIHMEKLKNKEFSSQSEEIAQLQDLAQSYLGLDEQGFSELYGGLGNVDSDAHWKEIMRITVNKTKENLVQNYLSRRVAETLGSDETEIYKFGAHALNHIGEKYGLESESPYKAIEQHPSQLINLVNNAERYTEQPDALLKQLGLKKKAAHGAEHR